MFTCNKVWGKLTNNEIVYNFANYCHLNHHQKLLLLNAVFTITDILMLIIRTAKVKWPISQQWPITALWHTYRSIISVSKVLNWQWATLTSAMAARPHLFHKLLSPFQFLHWYQLVLLCDRDKGVWTACLRLLHEWVSRGLTSHSTHYRSFRGRFLQVRWPNQQRQSTKESQLATEIGFSPTRTTPLCYNMN